MITLVSSTGQTTGIDVLPMGLRIADGNPLAFGKVHRSYMAVFTKDAPGQVRQLLTDQIFAEEQRSKHVSSGARPKAALTQIPVRYAEGVRLESDQPSKLRLVPAGGDNVAEHVVFATITGEKDTRLSVYPSHPEWCRVFSCAVDGNKALSSAVILAVGFNCKHLDGLAVVVKIKEAGKSLAELRVITPSGIYHGVINEEVFEMFVKRDQTIDLASLMERSAVKKKMSWSAVA